MMSDLVTDWMVLPAFSSGDYGSGGGTGGPLGPTDFCPQISPRADDQLPVFGDAVNDTTRTTATSHIGLTFNQEIGRLSSSLSSGNLPGSSTIEVVVSSSYTVVTAYPS